MGRVEDEHYHHLNAAIATLTEAVGRGFTRFEQKMDERFDGVEGRLDRVEGRLDRVESRITSVQGELVGVNMRLDGLERTRRR